jgi:hypothetical protein
MTVRELSDQIGFQIHPMSGSQRRERRLAQGDRDERDRESIAHHLGDSQAHPVDRDRALRHQILEHPLGRPDPDAPPRGLLGNAGHLAYRIHVALNQGALEGLARRDRKLEVQAGARLEVVERRAPRRLERHRGREALGIERCTREARTAHVDGAAGPKSRCGLRCAHHDAVRVALRPP